MKSSRSCGGTADSGNEITTRPSAVKASSVAMSPKVSASVQRRKGEAEFLRTHIAPIDRDGLLAGEVLRRVFVRRLEIIGEAAKKVPEDTPQICPLSNGAKWLGCVTVSSTITEVWIASSSGMWRLTKPVILSQTSPP